MGDLRRKFKITAADAVLVDFASEAHLLSKGRTLDLVAAIAK